MTLDQICVTKEWAGKLKEAGYPQESIFWWANKKYCSDGYYYSEQGEDDDYILAKEYKSENTSLDFAAPTASEILERSPIGIDIHRSDVGYTCHAVNKGILLTGYTESNLLAKMYCYLESKNLIKVED